MSDRISVMVDSLTGLMSGIVREGNGPTASVLKTAVVQSLRYYTSYDDTSLTSASGSAAAAACEAMDPHTLNLFPEKHVRGTESKQASGAYIFRPTEPNQESIPVVDEKVAHNVKPQMLSIAELVVVEGSEVVEIRQRLSNWAFQIIRLRAGSPAIEFEWRYFCFQKCYKCCIYAAPNVSTVYFLVWVPCL